MEKPEILYKFDEILPDTFFEQKIGTVQVQEDV